MAVARSLARIFFFLLLVSTAPAVRTVPASLSPSRTLLEACNRTLFPKVCLQALKDNPESQTAGVRRLAELAVYVSAEVGVTVAAFSHSELSATRDDALRRCLDACSEDVEEAVAHLSALARDFTDARFLEVKAWLASTLGDNTSTCESACMDAPVNDIKNAVITKSFEFEKLLRVTFDLITAASGSMSAAEVALPPSSKPSYGASAGAPSSYGAGAPGAYGPTPAAAGYATA